MPTAIFQIFPVVRTTTSQLWQSVVAANLSPANPSLCLQVLRMNNGRQHLLLFCHLFLLIRYFSFLFYLCLGPCPQSIPYVMLDCSSNSALVSWTPGYGILYYNASANAVDTSDRVTCSTTGFSCNMTRLQCAQTYQISISGRGNPCTSPSQGWVPVTTGNRSIKLYFNI